MKLNITQSTSLTEEVNTNILSKLYQVAHAGLDAGSDLQGRLHSAGGYANEIQWLTNTYQNLYITADAAYIQFEDDAVRQIVVNNWGSNGGITMDEIRLVTSIGNTFKQNTTITKFNEFALFPATGLDNCSFSGCTNLEELTLPSTFQNIHESFVQNCSKLKELTLPASVKTIEEGFATNSGLERLYAEACSITSGHWQLPSNYTYFNAGITKYLKELTIPDVDYFASPGSVDPTFEMTIPASVKCIGNDFAGDANHNGDLSTTVEKVEFEPNSQLEWFGSTSSYKNFKNGTIDVDSFTATHGTYNSLASVGSQIKWFINKIVNFPKDNIKVIPIEFRSGVANTDTEVADLIGNSVQIICPSAFKMTGTQTKQIIIPASCRIIGDSAFFGCCPPSYKILATTPPVLPVNINGTTGQPGYLFAESYGNSYPKAGTKIYVPAASLNAYKTTSGWSFYSSYYEAISE